MLFNFRLRALDEIAPWHAGKGENPHLGWYGLTMGWYWITAGGAELFRYSQPMVERWIRDYPDTPWMAGLPYDDYQVARLWMNVLDLLPEVLEPVPAPLARLIADTERWMAWDRQTTFTVHDVPSDEEVRALLHEAMSWWWQRRLDSAYLLAGPRIWFWSDEADVHIQWDNRGRMLDGIQAWEALLGQHTMPREAFIEEVRAFDARFIRRMHDRVAIAQGEWPHAGVALDPFLNEWQLSYSTSLQRVFERIPQREPTDWHTVLRAIARIKTMLPFAIASDSSLPL